jgi:hypothetical protein
MTMRDVQWRVCRVAAATAFLTLTAAVPVALAQAVNRSVIEGKITDETGLILPGVTVTIVSPALQVPQMVSVSDADGAYRFAALPAGVYTATYELSGFRMVRHEGLDVGGGFTAVVNVKLDVGALEETITVTGESPLVDVRNTSTQTNISSDLIESLPSSKTFYEILNMAEGVRTTIIDVGGNNFSESGGRSSGLAYGTNLGGYSSMLDGVNTIATAGYYDVNTMDDVVVRSGGSDAELSAPGFSFVGVIKSGGNEFHGSAGAQYQNPSLQSDNLNEDLQAKGVGSGNPMVRYYDVNADFGGRLIRDRLWFYGAVRDQQYKSKAIGYSVDAGPDRVYRTADDVEGFESSRLPNYTGKISGQLTSRQRVSWMHHYDGKDVPDRGGSIFKPREAAGHYTLPNQVFKGDWTYSANNNTVINALVGHSWWVSYQYPYSDLPSSQDTVTGDLRGAAINSSGIDSNPAGSYSGSWQSTASVSHLRQDFLGGDHEFKAGVEYYRDYYNKEQLLRGPGTGCARSVPCDYLLLLFSGQPLDVLLRNTPFLSRNNVEHRNMFVKDSWRASNRLTLNLGLRLDWSLGTLPAQAKAPGPFSEAATYPRKDIWDWVLLAPRTGFAYALTADNKTVLRASWGRFGFWVSPNEGGSILRDFNQNDYGAVRYKWNDVNGNSDFDFDPANPFASPELGAFVSTDGAKGNVYRPVDQPKVQEATIFLEREVANHLSVKAGYVYKKMYDMYRLVNLARPYEVYDIPITTVDPGPDGTVGTGDEGGPVTYYDYNPAYRGPAFEQSSYVNIPEDANRYHSLDLSVNRRFANRFQASLSFLTTRVDVYRLPVTPNNEFFPRDLYWDRSFKALGSYQAFWNIYTGFSYNYLSGAPQARDVVYRTGLRQLSTVTLRMEPLAAQRLPANHLLNLRAAKKFTVNGNDSIEIQFDLHNALNMSTIQAQTFRSGAAYGTISSILPPRVGRVGLSYRF